MDIDKAIEVIYNATSHEKIFEEVFFADTYIKTQQEEIIELKADLLELAKDVRSILNGDDTKRGQEETMFVADRLIRELKADQIIKEAK